MAAVTTPGTEVTPWQWSLDTTPEGAVLRLSGSWRMQDGLPLPALVEEQWGARQSAGRLAFDAHEVTAWDTGLLVFVLKMLEAATARGITVDRSGLPEGVRKLLDLAAAVPERDTKRDGEPQSFLERVGRSAIGVWPSSIVRACSDVSGVTTTRTVTDGRAGCESIHPQDEVCPPWPFSTPSDFSLRSSLITLRYGAL